MKITLNKKIKVNKREGKFPVCGVKVQVLLKRRSCRFRNTELVRTPDRKTKPYLKGGSVRVGHVCQDS